MSNPHRGDTEITVGEKTLTVCYDLNACAMVMEKLELKNFEDLANIGNKDGKAGFNLGLSEIIYILWAGLQRHHPELTEKEVGAMEWDIGQAASVIGKGLVRGLVRKTEAAGTIEKKAKRKSGTGS